MGGRRDGDQRTLGPIVALLVGVATLIAMLLGAGIYLGGIDARVRQLERQHDYEHGDMTPFLARGAK